jgi:carbon storage regulator
LQNDLQPILFSGLVEVTGRTADTIQGGFQMLVLGRKAGEVIRIDDDIVITVVSVGHGRVRIGIDAPKESRVLRGELCDAQSDSVLPAGTSRVVASH